MASLLHPVPRRGTRRGWALRCIICWRPATPSDFCYGCRAIVCQRHFEGCLPATHVPELHRSFSAPEPPEGGPSAA